MQRGGLDNYPRCFPALRWFLPVAPLGACSRGFLYDFGSRLAIGSRAKNWQVLGVDFDNVLQAASYSKWLWETSQRRHLPEARTAFSRMPASQADIDTPLHYTD